MLDAENHEVIGDMGLGMICIIIAAAGYLPPVAGAITQEVIDVLAVLNALRASGRPRTLSDYELGNWGA